MSFPVFTRSCKKSFFLKGGVSSFKCLQNNGTKKYNCNRSHFLKFQCRGQTSCNIRSENFLKGSAIHRYEKLFYSVSYNKPHGFRTSKDHRGTITPSNRPDSDFINREDGSSIIDDAAYAEMLHNAQGYNAGVVSKASLSGGVFIILPWIKWGQNKKTTTTETLMLDEATALASSLANVTVIEKVSGSCT